jgi:hypothetical protein
MIRSDGCDIQASVPAERLDELLVVLTQAGETTGDSLACGVGADLREAAIALRVARNRGGDPAVVLFTPSVADEDRKNQEVSHESIFDEKSKDGLTKADGQPSGGEATKIQQGQLSATAAEPSPPSPPSPSDAAPPGQQGAPAQGGKPSNQQLLQAVGQVLADVKKQLPGLEEMKKQNPGAYQAVMAMTQAVVALAQQLGGGQQGQPVQKSAWNGRVRRTYGDKVANVFGRLFKAEPPIDWDEFANGFRHEQAQGKGKVDDHEATLKVLHNILRNPKHYSGLKLVPPTQEIHKDEPSASKPLKPTKTGRHELHLPVGSVRDGRSKVMHGDGKAGWVQERAGTVTSPDGHTTSSRQQGCSHKTQTVLNQAGQPVGVDGQSGQAG